MIGNGHLMLRKQAVTEQQEYPPHPSVVPVSLSSHSSESGSMSATWLVAQMLPDPGQMHSTAVCHT